MVQNTDAVCPPLVDNFTFLKHKVVYIRVFLVYTNLIDP